MQASATRPTVQSDTMICSLCSDLQQNTGCDACRRGFGLDRSHIEISHALSL